MKIETFEMERMQSTWENVVRYNLSESGVHPVKVEELLTDPADRDALLRIELGYSQSNGTEELRRKIAELYSGADERNVMVTTGTAEANFLVTWLLSEMGDEAVVVLPNYMQVWGLLRGFGAEIKPVYLDQDNNWALDAAALRAALSPRTKLIAVCNPNNPTGSVLTSDAMDSIVAAARSVNSWLLVDEVYRGAELIKEMTESFWGRYEKVIITSGLSKAYGLPGLRIGWIVSTPDIVANAWGYHDYLTIGPNPASDFLARIALRPEMRTWLLNRTRDTLNANYPIVRNWVDRSDGTLSLNGPDAGAIAYVRYDLNVGSLEFVNSLNNEKSVLIVPGDHFRMGKYLRIGYGAPADVLREGLRLIDELVIEHRWS